MRFTILVPVALAMTAGPVFAAPTQSRNYPIGGFTKLRVEGPFGVHVRTGSKASATALGPSDKLERLVVEVRGDTLVVGTQRSAWSWGSKMGGNVVVNVTVPTLLSARLTGSGDVDIDRIRAGSFDAGVGGSGNLTIGPLDTPRLDAKVDGSGSLSLSGRTGTAKAEVNGSGHLRARDLGVNLLTAQVTGSGSIDIGPTRVARASITGSGDIRIGGRPTCTEHKVGSGTIRCGDNPRSNR